MAGGIFALIAGVQPHATQVAQSPQLINFYQFLQLLRSMF